jgi:biopolymer transport protein ExbD
MRVRRLKKAPAHLEVTAFINLIVVLVPFLLSTAVFSRLAVMDMALPGPGGALDQLAGDKLQLEVVVRRDALEVGDRVGGLIQRIPNNAKGHDLAALSSLALQLKTRFPQQQDASVLAEPDTPYDQIVQVMDALHSTVSAKVAGQEGRPARAELFPQIALGDAPVRGASAPASAPAK